jgi:type VI protein secretion system component VasF
MRTIVTALLVCTLCMIVPSWAQDASTPVFQRGTQGRPPGAAPPPTPAEIEIQKRMAKERNQERFAQLKKDTDHLLELATQLKKSVDEANDQTLSLEVIRKAEQIEKLAKQVRQKMVAQ